MLETIGEHHILLADAAYDRDAHHTWLADRGALANIKPVPGRKEPPKFSPLLYHDRHRVKCQQDQTLLSHRHAL